jgi:hypothetical protein
MAILQLLPYVGSATAADGHHHVAQPDERDRM